MGEILHHYLNSFLHPFQTQDILRDKRKINKVKKDNQIFEIVGHENSLEEEKCGIDFLEALSVTWVFSLMKGIYSILALYLGLEALKSTGSDFVDFMPIQLKTTSLNIYLIILNVVLFPLTLWIYTKFWVNIIKLFSNIFDIDEDMDVVANEIVNNSLASHTFLIIPIFGDIIKHFAGLIYIFAGLRRNLNLNVFQSLTVLIFPLILFLLLVFLMFLSIGMLIMSF